MRLVHYFSPQPGTADIPAKLRDPFDNTPHELARHASKLLQVRISSTDELTSALFTPQGGKMFGVLVVRDSSSRIGYLASFSGMLMHKWQVPGFVPPIFDPARRAELITTWEQRLNETNRQINIAENDPAFLKAQQDLLHLQQRHNEALSLLKQQHQARKKYRHQLRNRQDQDGGNETLSMALSRQSQQDRRQLKQCRRIGEQQIQALQQHISTEFGKPIHNLKKRGGKLERTLQTQQLDSYQLNNILAENVTLTSLFDGKTPPAGSGDCAAPKLLHYALTHGLRPLALTEFWWGASDSEAVHHSGFFYPPCRGRCRPLLRHQLKGMELEATPVRAASAEPGIIHEDDDLVVVNKPAGLLSVPGNDDSDNVQHWLQHRYAPDLHIQLVHRLDMSTSGLLIAAKRPRVHKLLQKQFSRRQIQKRYVAVLCRPLGEKSGTIDLPLRVDLNDRPRQRVCREHGKQAITRMEVISTDAHSSRVYFYPLTGRTHQLRVHAAHPLGLDAPICGDELYGSRSDRLKLHAEQLIFHHPTSGRTIRLQAPTPF